jgi:hypothetical protein
VVSFPSVPAPKICLAALITLGTSQRFPHQREAQTSKGAAALLTLRRQGG